MMARTVKVAIVGSGLAGLTAAYLLSKAKPPTGVEFEVHLFEKEASLGMDASSVSIPTPDGNKEWRVDVPMRSFQGGYYPQLISLYKTLGVNFRRADFSYSFSHLSPFTDTQNQRINTTMIYNGLSGRAGVSMPSFMNKPYTPTKSQPIITRTSAKVFVWLSFVLATLQVLFSFIRIVWLSLPFLRPKCIEQMTFREWSEYSVPRGIIIRWTGMDVAWRDFTSQILVPLFSAICTAAENDVMEHPVEEFLDYVWLTFGTHHYVVTNGVREVVSRLTDSLAHIHLSSPISSVSYIPSNPNLLSIDCTHATYSGFSHVIFATQASSAIPLLSSYLSSLPSASSQREKVGAQIACLQSFEYRHTIVINHTDETLQPHNSEDRRDLNLIYSSTSKHIERTKAAQDIASLCLPTTYTMATHVLQRPASYPPDFPQVYQTTNPIVAPREDSILSVAKLERAVLTPQAKKALGGLYQEESRRWWQCAGYGVTGLGPLQGAGKLTENKGENLPGIWICGSYAFAGIPLLEGCVGSARNVVEKGILRCEGQ